MVLEKRVSYSSWIEKALRISQLKEILVKIFSCSFSCLRSQFSN